MTAESKPYPEPSAEKPAYKSPLLEAIGDGKCRRCGRAIAVKGLPVADVRLEATRTDIREAARHAIGAGMMGFPLGLAEVMGMTPEPTSKHDTLVSVKVCAMCCVAIQKATTAAAGLMSEVEAPVCYDEARWKAALAHVERVRREYGRIPENSSFLALGLFDDDERTYRAGNRSVALLESMEGCE